MKKNLICFLTHRPSGKFYNFCRTLCSSNYDVVVVVDDDQHSIHDIDKCIPIVKIDSNVCESQGFRNMVCYFKDKACSKDKSMYWIYSSNKKYKNIWLIEEDVLLSSSDCLERIDSKYPNADLLSRDLVMKEDSAHWVHWKKITDEDLPWCRTMTCAIRFSDILFSKILEYVHKNNRLLNDEMLFTTLALHHNLDIVHPKELKYISYKKYWDWENIKVNKDYLYHPVKDVEEQYFLRKIAA